MIDILLCSTGQSNVANPLRGATLGDQSVKDYGVLAMVVKPLLGKMLVLFGMIEDCISAKFQQVYTVVFIVTVHHQDPIGVEPMLIATEVDGCCILAGGYLRVQNAHLFPTQYLSHEQESAVLNVLNIRLPKEI